MSYTINKLAKLAGVSVRTLHYYDEIGLLTPKNIQENGYREYGDAEVARLQQILFFRELEFPLEKIKAVMNAPQFDPLDALTDQKELLQVKKERLEKIIMTLQKTIDERKGGVRMQNDDKFSAFNDPNYQKYKDEVLARWGNTNLYKQSMARVGKLTKGQFDAIKKEGGEITTSIARLMKEGKGPNSLEVQKEIDRYYHYLFHFYDPSPEMFKALGAMYVDDSRFRGFYEKIVPGLAVFMRDAMALYADECMK